MRDSIGTVTAAVGIVGPAQRLSKRDLVAIAPKLIEVSQAVGRRLADHSRVAATLRRA